MKTIANFELNSTFEAIREGGTLAYPNTSYIKEISLLSIERTPKPNYMYVEALEDGLQVLFKHNVYDTSNGHGVDHEHEVYYSQDKTNWKLLQNNEYSISINTGERLYFKCSSIPCTYMSNGLGQFTITKRCNVAGNVTSILYGDDCDNRTDLKVIDLHSSSLALKDYANAFKKLFYNCTTIVDASKLDLHSKTLTNACYREMFSGCTSLIATPELCDDVTMNEACYWGMFESCTSLTVLPKLNNMSLSKYCYAYIFSGCTSLIDGSQLQLPATTLSSDCYKYMFYNCNNLTSAPILHVGTLSSYCYFRMFSGCSKLNNITMLATDINATSCLYEWVYGVASAGTLYKHPDMTTLPTGTSGIPSGWTVVDYAA